MSCHLNVFSFALIFPQNNNSIKCTHEFMRRERRRGSEGEVLPKRAILIMNADFLSTIKIVLDIDRKNTNKSDSALLQEVAR